METPIHYLEDSELGRFLLFRYDTYYPGGGLRDAVDFDTLPELLEELERYGNSGHIEVFDCLAQKEIDITKYGFKY